LLLLATGANGDGTLYAWSNGKMQHLADMPGAASFGTVCAAPAGAPLPADLRSVCAMEDTGISLGDGKGDTLFLGPAQLGATPAPRFVTLINATGSVQVRPPIRIDSRFHLAGTYLPFADKFIVQANVAPASLESAVVRRWSKRNCLDYWEVSPKTGVATPECIPFGPYVGDVPTVLPTQAGVFLAVGADGLYRISNGTAQPAMAGVISNAVVSPRGDAIAFDLAPGPASVAVASGSIIVLQLSGAPGTR
jgi:hypothetical protein